MLSRRALSGLAEIVSGSRVLTASQDRTARLWPIFGSVDGLIEEAKRCLPRQLSSAQRGRFYLPDC